MSTTTTRGDATVIVDTEAFEREVPRVLDAITRHVEQNLSRLAINVQNRAREACPVDTGRLRASILHTPGRDERGPYVDVGTNVEYGPFVEYGTQRTRPQPFMRPALLDAGRTWSELNR